MKALVYTGKMQNEIWEMPEPVAGEGYSIIDLAFCGICGSDMHAWHGHDERRIPPLILGHEGVGTVLEGPQKGKRVAINPLMTCGKCEPCRAGRTHLCSARELIGMRAPGAFAERVAIRDENLLALPDGVDLARAALIEPLACSLHAVRLGLKSSVKEPDQSKIVILGGGAIGLLCGQVAQNFGYSDLWIAERNPRRRTIIEKTVGVRTYDPLSEKPDVGADGAVDVIIDAVGSLPTRQSASELVAPGGVIVHIGLQDNNGGLDVRRMTLQEITFHGSYCYSCEDFAESLSLIEQGIVTGEGWSEIRPLSEGAKSFIDIDQGAAPPKIILSTAYRDFG